MPRYYPKMSLRERIATPDGKRRIVRAIFATIADRYDLITVLLSYGQDRRWKRRLIDRAAPGPGARALDLATGTGDLAFALAARGARVVGLDITLRMIELAKHKTAASGPTPRRRKRYSAPIVRRCSSSATCSRCRFPPALRDQTTGYGAAERARPDDGDQEIGQVRRRRTVVAGFQPPVEPRRRAVLAYLRWSAPRSAGRCTTIGHVSPHSRTSIRVSRRGGGHADVESWLPGNCYPVLAG